MTDYCFPDVTVEELADKIPQLFGYYPHQLSPKARLRCQTLAIALKSIPQCDPRTERLLEILQRGLDNQDEELDLEFTLEFPGELRKLIT